MDDRMIQEQITYYRRRAGEYDETATPEGDPFAPQGRRLEAALDAFAPSGRVLEIACGTGNWTRKLAQHAAEITALDSSPEVIELAQTKVGAAPVDFVIVDVFTWEPDSRYDVVFFAFWLSHVPMERFEDFWRLVDRCLASDGRVFFTDEAEDVWRNENFIQPELVQRTLRDGSSHRVIKVFWDPSELEARLRELGWAISVTSTGAFFWGEGRRGHRN